MYTPPDPQQAGPQATLPPTLPPAPPAPPPYATSVAVPPPSSRLDLWVMWIGAAVAGVFAASLVNYVITPVIPHLSGPRESGLLSSIITGAIAGALIGLAQWFVLRRYLPAMPIWTWPIATAFGIVLSYVVYYVLPVTESGFVGIVGGISGCLIPLLVGPLAFVAKRLENRRVIAAILVFVIGMISFGLDRVITPAVESTITESEGLYGLAQTIARNYILAGIVGLGQWMGLRLYLPHLKWWYWVLAAVAGGVFAGLVRGVGFLILSYNVYSFLPTSFFNMIGTGLIATATGFVLIRVLPSAPAVTPQVESAPAPPA